MKKLYVFIIVTLLILMGINLFNNVGNRELSNEELIAMRLEECGIHNYDEIECREITIDESIYIDYITYLDGDITNGGWIMKDYCIKKYTR